MSSRIAKLCVGFTVCLTTQFFGLSSQVTGAPTEAQKSQQFFHILHDHFAEWDTNHNGELSADELDALISDPKIKGDVAAVVSVLKDVQRNKKRWHIDAYTTDALQTYSQKGDSSDPNTPRFGHMYFSFLEHINKPNRQLFADGPPSLETIHQGRLGDCYFLAPLGAAVNRDGKAVANLIVPNADGSYEVNFGFGHHIHVPRLTDTEIVLTTSTRRGGLWLNILENAYSSVRYDSTPEKRKSDSTIDMVARGGSPGPVLKLLTGHEVSHMPFRAARHKDTPPDDSQAQELIPKLRNAISSAIDERRLICCGTPGYPNSPGITTSHVYAILDFDKAKDIVEVWNPHGNHFQPKGPQGLQNGYVTKGGRFFVPLNEFIKIFGGVSFEILSGKGEPDDS